MRFLFRFLAIGSLSLAVIAAVTDAARVIATGKWTYEPLAQSWHENMPDVLALVWGAIDYERLRPMWDAAMAAVLALPGWLVFGALALAFYAIGRRRSRPGGTPAV